MIRIHVSVQRYVFGNKSVCTYVHEHNHIDTKIVRTNVTFLTIINTHKPVSSKKIRYKVFVLYLIIININDETNF